nr:hypothetical protein [Tanacetum cinerariifolium]
KIKKPDFLSSFTTINSSIDVSRKTEKNGKVSSPLTPRLPSPGSAIIRLTYGPLRIEFTSIRDTTSGTPPVLPIPLPASSLPLLLPSTDCRADVLEVTLPPRKRLCIALGPRFEVMESSSAPTARPTRGFIVDYGFFGTLDDDIRRDPERDVGYEITNTWDEIVKDMQGTPAATDVAGLSQRMTDFVMTVRQDTNEIYGRLDDAQDDRL